MKTFALNAELREVSKTANKVLRNQGSLCNPSSCTFQHTLCSQKLQEKKKQKEFEGYLCEGEWKKVLCLAGRKFIFIEYYRK